jgi:hypothetical protein
MSSIFNWQCPYCNRHTTIIDEQQTTDLRRIQLNSKLGAQALVTFAIACPNEDCKELFVAAQMGNTNFNISINKWIDDEPHSKWILRPEANVRQFPDYVPSVVIQDYREACLIKDLSPKASATLARRCLQGMIRDFWHITKSRLVDEIDALKDKVDNLSWSAIDAVRKIGNIGAHMEKDVNVIVDVDTSEATSLLQLIETLIEEWYIARHDRERRMKEIVDAASAKDAKKIAAKKPISPDKETA